MDSHTSKILMFLKSFDLKLWQLR